MVKKKKVGLLKVNLLDSRENKKSLPKIVFKISSNSILLFIVFLYIILLNNIFVTSSADTLSQFDKTTAPTPLLGINEIFALPPIIPPL